MAAPTVTKITDKHIGSDLAAGETVEIKVHFSEAVHSTGSATPSIVLSNGDVAILEKGNGTDTLTFKVVSSGGMDLTVTSISDFANGSGRSLVYPGASGDDTICFMAGTHILTPTGEVGVEVLKVGDMVVTSDGRAAPVRWLGLQTVTTMFADPLRVLPIRIKAGALSDNTPTRDLLVSPDHALLVGKVLIQAAALVNGVSIVREVDVPTAFTYYHVELDDHALVLAEGVAAETFIDNVDRMAFDNWNEHETLYPQGKAIAEMAYPRAKAYRQVPTNVRSKLMLRADALYPLAIDQAA